VPALPPIAVLALAVVLTVVARVALGSSARRQLQRSDR
jgi:hypothetical protein